MSTANEILNFNFSTAALQNAAKHTFSIQLNRILEKRILKLHKINEEVGESSYKLSGEILIPHIFKKFKILMNSGKLDSEYFGKRDLRTLTYSISYSEKNNSSIFCNLNELDFVFSLFELNWKDSFLYGLIDCYLNNWETKYLASSEKLGNYIIKKLFAYKGNRPIFNSLKNNSNFFNRINGDLSLGSELAIKKLQIREAPKYLSIPDSWFSYTYFSKVILAYYVKRQNDIQLFIDDLNYALQEHNNPTTNKRVVSRLIIQANSPEFASIQDKVKSIAFKLVGDPGKVANWSVFENATENEKNDLKKARGILNEWITRQFINVFFEKCINDSRRKRFWLKYAKDIVQFRVVGSSIIKKILLNDTRISEYVNPRFSNTNSSRDRNAALMFAIKNHLFIEFSDEGAFYAYKLSNPNAPSIEKEYFYSTSYLKNTSFDWLAYRTGRTIYRMSDEGRLGHTDGDLVWEEVATYWLKNKAGINV